MKAPQAGDVARATKQYIEVQPGWLAVIGGVEGQPLDCAEITFRHSTFRGNAYNDADPICVSASGGPGFFVPLESLTATGEIVEARFWCWQPGGPRANNGIPYYLDKPVWDWDPGVTWDTLKAKSAWQVTQGTFVFLGKIEQRPPDTRPWVCFGRSFYHIPNDLLALPEDALKAGVHRAIVAGRLDMQRNGLLPTNALPIPSRVLADYPDIEEC